MGYSLTETLGLTLITTKISIELNFDRVKQSCINSLLGSHTPPRPLKISAKNSTTNYYYYSTVTS